MMKLGIISAILDMMDFEEVIDYASSMGLECVELCCWPKGKAVRRYAGVTHIDADTFDDGKRDYILDYCRKKNVEISSLAYYPNTMDPDRENRKTYSDHLMKLIDVSARLGVNMVTTFLGRDCKKTVEDNLKDLKGVWEPLLNHAGERGVKIAIENCPMLFTNDEWPGGQNLMTTPDLWRRVFEILPQENLGLNYDPSHLVWQQIDYIKPIYEFQSKIFHVHCKDIKVFRDKLDDVGIMATPLQFMSPKIPGLGDVDWKKYVSALTDINYKGYVAIEIEDKAFEGSVEEVMKALSLSINYLRNFI